MGCSHLLRPAHLSCGLSSSFGRTGPAPPVMSGTSTVRVQEEMLDAGRLRQSNDGLPAARELFLIRSLESLPAV